ncbi:MAG: type IV pilus twitching motility protein PilT [bacterium]
MPKIDPFLKIMQDVGASDLHISAGSAPLVRINGVLDETKHKALTEEEVDILLYELLSDSQIAYFEKKGEIDIAYTLPGVARFRINIFKKYPGLAAAFRLIPHTIPNLDGLGFPPVLKELLTKKSGLILVTGAANSGKSTTLAAMIDYLNEYKNYHIITLEDPLEFIHPNKNCLIHQRQIGEHSNSFANALRAVLREDPNVVLVGEMRDNESISLAVTAAEVGLLVLGTLHTKSAAQTVSRLIDVFPSDQQSQMRHTLSEVLICSCSQQLLRRADGKGRIAAIEIMVCNHAISNLIRESKPQMMNNSIMTGKKEGMQLMEQHLKELVEQGIITVKEAASHTENPHVFLSCGKETHSSHDTMSKGRLV